MSMLRILVLCLVSCTSIVVYGETQPPAAKGVILAIEGDMVFLDLHELNTTVGARYQVIRDQGYFTHPVTGEIIRRNPEVVAYIQISKVHSNYSEGLVSPVGAINALDVGMEAHLLEGADRETREFRKSIAVQPMNVSSARGGYLGFYIADLLTEELFNVNKFRVIDRQTLGLQMDEIALASQGIIDEREAVAIGRTKGVDYFITGTVYEPDVVETATGVPIKGIMQTAEAISGRKLGSRFVSDVKVSRLRAIVNITLRVVDVQTGEILFIASEMQQAVGQSQVDLEQGVLGGMQLQGGATSFLSTITGQATRAALVSLAGYINDYFEGTINERNFRGNVIDIGKVGTSAERRDTRKESENAQIIQSNYDNNRNAQIRLLSLENNTAIKYQIFSATVDRGSEAGYREGRRYNVYEPNYIRSRINDSVLTDGYTYIGYFLLTIIESNMARGLLYVEYDQLKPEDYSFDEAIVVRSGSP